MLNMSLKSICRANKTHDCSVVEVKYDLLALHIDLKDIFKRTLWYLIFVLCR